MTHSAFSFRVFAGGLAAGIVVIFVLQLFPIRFDLFKSNQNSARILLDRMAAEDIAELKVWHASQNARYRLGVFGNSRSLDVPAASVNESGKFYFNFSVTGSSIRQSVALLEVLENLDKAPEVAVISLDNFEIQLFANPSYPPPPGLSKNMVTDLAIALGAQSISSADRVRIFWRNANDFWTWFTGRFNLERLRNRLVVAGDWFIPTSMDAPYRDDGSRLFPATGMIEILPRARRMHIPALFENDLHRLENIQRHGTRIIIYESPLEPHSAQFYALRPSPFAVELRQQLRNSCAALKFECYDATNFPSDSSDAWPDATHPPSRVLGRYIESLVRRSHPQIGAAE